MLIIDWCSHDAALHAVMNWHYSQRMPSGKLVKVGAWEDDLFIGCVVFGRGANNHLMEPYGLDQTEGCELVRVALTTHQAPVSRIVAQAMKMLRQSNPGLRLVVSFADPLQGHRGGIYQAGNWTYLGMSRPQTALVINGRLMHKRTVSSRYGTGSVARLKEMLPRERVRHSAASWKHLYVMPLDRGMRRQIGPLGLPYPRG